MNADLLSTFEIVSETLVQHRASTRGVVIGKVLRAKLGNEVADVRFWYNWENGSLHHIDSIPVA